ncbi:NCS2 family permease [Methanocella conradii]|uniref:NCS2 family permease n=1 Tax=Methanocella conradii TaxID=1175444 RepID=UPI00157DD6BB|nr:NCS2 family permease [Methanocella conradii]
MYEQTQKKNVEGSSITSFLDKYFHISERNSNIRTEIIAGVTTFMTMAYIIIVNPGILSAAGMDFKAVFVATCLAAALSTFLMGVIGKYPFALAPGMGMNAVVTFGICIGMGLSWQIAMALIFIEGLVILILVLTNLRELVMNSIPGSLKIAIGVAIGLFIAFIGFKDSGMMVSNPSTYIGFGSMSNPVVIVSLIGLIIIMALMALKVKGSILYGIILTSIIALIMCFAADAAGIAFNVYNNANVPMVAGAALPEGLSNLPSWGGSIIELPNAATLSTVGQLDIMGALNIGILTLVTLVFALGMVDFFDTMGTVVAVGGQAKLLDKDGKLPGLKNVLMVDSLAAMIGGFMGCSSNTTYVESASGVSAGGRTGLASVVTSVLFLVAMLFVPLAYLIPGAATAPALIIVGFLMLTLVKDIPWDKLEDALPAFLTIVGMMFTFSISKGIGFGFISYCLIKTASGKWRDVHPIMWIVAFVFALYFIFVSSII